MSSIGAANPRVDTQRYEDRHPVQTVGILTCATVACMAIQLVAYAYLGELRKVAAGVPLAIFVPGVMAEGALVGAVTGVIAASPAGALVDSALYEGCSSIKKVSSAIFSAIKRAPGATFGWLHEALFSSSPQNSNEK